MFPNYPKRFYFDFFFTLNLHDVTFFYLFNHSLTISTNQKIRRKPDFYKPGTAHQNQNKMEQAAAKQNKTVSQNKNRIF